MKLIFIGKESPDNNYISLCRSFNIEVIHYTNPLKASDNYKEIGPDMVYFKEGDFPRLWKIILSSLRDLYDETETQFILEGDCDDELYRAFKFLKGNHILDSNDKVIENFRSIITGTIGQFTPNKTYVTNEGEIGIGFINPEDYSFISCNVLQLYNDHIRLSADSIEESSFLTPGIKISEASINFNEEVINVDLEVLDISGDIICKIINGQQEYEDSVLSLFV